MSGLHALDLIVLGCILLWIILALLYMGKRKNDKEDCGNCARHCPTGAIQMIPKDENDESSPKIPVVNTERCIGCGACENLCPARPFSAIYVEGHEMHRVI